VVIGDLVI